MNKFTNKTKSWRKVKLGEFATVNPQVKLKSGEVYPFLDMAEVVPLTPMSTLKNSKIFKGSGAHFEKGDTLFARITPCLENGKITRVKELNSPAFGSTEFYVLRERQGISDSNFIYYLALTNEVRKKAEQCMIGASGRQRVERAVFENIEVKVPEDVNEQKRIAGILSSFDDKIENNNRIIKNLEETAKTIFKEWFVNFRFPGHEKTEFVNSKLGKIPKGWINGALKDIAIIIMGQSPKSENYNSNKEGLPFHQGVAYFGGRFPIHEIYSINGEKKAKEGDLLFSVRAPVGRINIADRDIILGRGLASLRQKRDKQSFLYYLLKQVFKKEDSVGSGSIFPAVTKEELAGHSILIPFHITIDIFEEYVSSMDRKIRLFAMENIELEKSRNLLLPKLMSGKI